jgi:hypothetical protein
MSNIRVPRKALLSRYLKVTQDNQVTRQGDPKVLYSIMMTTRLAILYICSLALGNSLTIAIRYGSMRTQFKTLKQSKEERQIIDYQTHQFRITNCLAFYMSVIFVKKEMDFQYDKMLRGIENKDFSLMAPIHINLAGIKAYFTTESFQAVKVLRECCGAAGFMRAAGFYQCHDTMAPLVTLEGDSVVMNLQTARALLKIGKKALLKDNFKIMKQLSYIADIKKVQKKELKIDLPTDEAALVSVLHKEETLLELLRINALQMLYKVIVYLNLEDKTNKLSQWEKQNQYLQLDII